MDTPLTVTTTLPVEAPLGTVTAIEVSLQLLAVAVTPLNVTVLVPCVEPKPEPVIVTDVPTGPEIGDIPVIFGVVPPPPTAALNAAIAVSQPLAGDNVQVPATGPAKLCTSSSSA